MEVITKADLALRVPLVKRYGARASYTKLLESETAVPLDTKFDVFLSHSYQDAQMLSADDLALAKALIESYGFTVYVDWLVETDLDRAHVTRLTALRIRRRMKNSRSLLYATSQSSSKSKWMPWELGYKDGENGRVAILPILDPAASDFEGQEYLGIYPYVAKGFNTSQEPRLWIKTNRGTYVEFEAWLNGRNPYKHS